MSVTAISRDWWPVGAAKELTKRLERAKRENAENLMLTGCLVLGVWCLVLVLGVWCFGY
jgi:hypothetical protein